MVTVNSYLRIYHWRGLSGKILTAGEPDPHATALAIIQLAALARQPSPINEAIPLPLYRVLRQQVDDRGATCGDMSDPVARGLFLSDLYDFLRIFKRTEVYKNFFALPEKQGE